MNDRVEEVIHYRKFLDKLEDDVDEQLKRQKKATPSGIFYNLCWNEQYPGYISLRFILSQTPRHYPVAITPAGYAWGKTTYENLDRLINDFKKNPRGSQSTGRKATPTSSITSQRQAPLKPSERPSRWGAKSSDSSVTSQAVSSLTSAYNSVSSMTSSLVPAAAAQAGGGGGWGASSGGIGGGGGGGGGGGWSETPRPPRPPPSMPPPPNAFRPAPPSGPPPSFGDLAQPPPAAISAAAAAAWPAPTC